MTRFAALFLLALSQSPIPSGPMAMRDFRLRFDGAGTFMLDGDPEWPAIGGTWMVNGNEILLKSAPGSKPCSTDARYTWSADGARFALDVISDTCADRRMVLDRSRWLPPGAATAAVTRNIVRHSGPATGPLPRARRSGLPAVASAEAGDWPTFRGREASGVSEKQNLPDTWNPATGDNILWKTRIPGLAHSSPIVFGDTIFVTSAISSRADATFKPGLYGDGDASEDRTSQRWMLYAIDKRTGRIRWERVAARGEPKNKRHIKSTYASASPATDGRIVVAWFGSQGIFAYDMDGGLRWSVDLGRVDMGAYDIPAYEWGPASSPIIWNGLVIVQCDTQADSFVLALNAETGETVWKTDRNELPSWGTPNVVVTPAGPELITNASNFIRGYDPKTGQELWKLGGSSKITAPTPIFSNGLHIIASGRAPERPVFAVKPGARGDLTLAKDARSNAQVVWSKTGRGSYMPTPLAYRGILYILANNGVFDAYDPASGKEIYRQRLPLVGSGYSASPVAADGKIYLSNEDGEMLVIEAGNAFKHLATNSMGETIMATPALSDGVMFVRGASTLFAIARK
jgi:outer membrane protein assembly factor BamB